MRANPIFAAPMIAVAGVLAMVSASARPPQSDGSGTGADRHDAVVDGRQAAFKLSLSSFLALKAAITRGDDPKTMVQPAKALAAWGRAIPGMFPSDVHSPRSRALLHIWADRAGFTARAADMATAAEKFASLAAAGDAAALSAQWDVLKGSCAACHDKYRAPDEKK